jgi:hypothetical protein
MMAAKLAHNVAIKAQKTTSEDAQRIIEAKWTDKTLRLPVDELHDKILLHLQEDVNSTRRRPAAGGAPRKPPSSSRRPPPPPHPAPCPSVPLHPTPFPTHPHLSHLAFGTALRPHHRLFPQQLQKIPSRGSCIGSRLSTAMSKSVPKSAPIRRTRLSG